MNILVKFILTTLYYNKKDKCNEYSFEQILIYRYQKQSEVPDTFLASQ